MDFEKKFFVMGVLLVCSLSSLYSQELKTSDAYMELPATAMQYRDAVTVTVHYKPSLDGDVDSFQWIDPWGAFLDISSSTGQDANGYTTVSRTIIFLTSGNITIASNKVSKSITVQSNPLGISVPNHICPSGTQLTCTTAISALLTKSYSVSGVSTAKITDTGFLTYDSKENGTVKAKVALLYGNSTIVQSDEKNISLNVSHIPSGNYSFDYNGAPYNRAISTNNNPVDWGVMITSDFYLSGMTNFSWSLLTLDAAVNISHVSLGADRHQIKFKPVGNIGDIITLRLKYNKPGCPNLITYDCNFVIEGSYSIAYSSDALVIKKQMDQKSRSIDQYLLIDALNGNLVKKGQLTQEITYVDVSGVPKSLYIVKIISESCTRSFKVSIK